MTKREKFDEKVEEKEEAVVLSPAKEAFTKLVEAYKKQNPVKYEQKKVELEAQLAAIQ